MPPFRRVLSVAAVALSLTPPAASGCEVALLLAIDVSGSVDPAEYRLQADGTADALADPDVAEALVQGQIALSLVHWSGTRMQDIVLPWRRMLNDAEVTRFAGAARGFDRSFDESDTAVGEALRFAAGTFGAVADCKRLVIDISGDGPQNAGAPLPELRGAVLAAGIEINAIAVLPDAAS